MTESFLILLAGGVMLAATVADPKQVTLQWLRLAGIIALALAGVGMYFLLTRAGHATINTIILSLFIALVLGQLAFVQVAWRSTQRWFAGISAVASIVGATLIIRQLTSPEAQAVPQAVRGALQAIACAGVAAMTGFALMDMLLGHAYLTASKMTISPFMRLNRWLAGSVVFRAICAVVLAMALQAWRPVSMLGGIYGLYIGTRWLVGLVVPAAFVYMAHDCIKRRSTQSATGILYVAGILIFIGEIVGLYLVKETGLPF